MSRNRDLCEDCGDLASGVCNKCRVDLCKCCMQEQEGYCEDCYDDYLEKKNEQSDASLSDN